MTPETWVAFLIGIPIGWFARSWHREEKQRRRAILLYAVRTLEPNASTLEIGRLVERKVPFGSVYFELHDMYKEGILDRRVEDGGPDRGYRDRVFYSIRLEGSK